MPEFNHQQDDSGGLVSFIIAFLGLILFIGAISAMALLFS